MKKSYLFMAFAAIAIIFSSCEPLEVNETYLYGCWQNSDPGSQEYMRFLTAEQEAMDGEYHFGKEWNEGDGVYEGDLTYKGNGWFKWKIIQTNMTRINFMENGTTQVPKTYVVKKLTTSDMQLQDPNDKSLNYYYHKVNK